VVEWTTPEQLDEVIDLRIAATALAEFAKDCPMAHVSDSQ
jgi:hypothetical protein